MESFVDFAIIFLSLFAFLSSYVKYVNKFGSYCKGHIYEIYESK
jgi:hypothetical protein